jgi:hypothetical protein
VVECSETVYEVCATEYYVAEAEIHLTEMR